MAGATIQQDEAPDDDAPETDKDLLGLYLSDHLVGATAGGKRIERMVEDLADTPVYAALADQIRTERAFMHRLIEHLEFRRRPIAEAISWTGERVGTLRGNGPVFDRSSHCECTSRSESIPTRVQNRASSPPVEN